MPDDRKPGAGLGQLFPPDEAPTSKLPTVPEPAPPNRVACPMCNGRGVLRVSAYLNDEACPTCKGQGNVTRLQHDEYIKTHPGSLAAQLARKKT